MRDYLMLTKKQEAELAIMTAKYRMGMEKSSKYPIHLIKAWTLRYRTAMRQELQRQSKH